MPQNIPVIFLEKDRLHEKNSLNLVVRRQTKTMRRVIKIILTILIFNSICKAQETDSLIYDIEELDLGVDSLYSIQLELKSKQGTLSDCEFAMLNANKDFNDKNYILHSDAFSGNCSYCAVLKQDYNVNWEFTIDLFSDEYYHCYDSIISEKLIEKYNCDIFMLARMKSDSLINTGKWISNAEYYGGQHELMKFIMTRLTVDSTDMSDGIKTKLYIELEIDTTGKAFNPIIRRGIGEKTDNKVVDIINEMPNWKPAYLYGRPIRQKYFIPINIDYQ